jgi:small redox-active disulfide protein 2
MIIKILGSGCKKCEKLEKNTQEALKDTKIQGEIVKIKDYKDIISYGVMTTPALVINDEVVSIGKVLKAKEILKYLEKAK